MDALRAAVLSRGFDVDTSSPLRAPLIADVFASYVGIVILGATLYLVGATAMFLKSSMRPANKSLFRPSEWLTTSRKGAEDRATVVRREIRRTLLSLPLLAVLLAPLDVMLRRGHGAWCKDPLGLSHPVALAAYHGLVVVPAFIVGVDFVVYWLHRGMHHRHLYKTLGHNVHHHERFTTAFSAFAFHPADGGLQAVPGYVFFLVLPCDPRVAAALLAVSNLWVLMLHDVTARDWGPLFATANAHTVHHEDFDYNYGQFTTLWDRVFGTYRVRLNALTGERYK